MQLDYLEVSYLRNLQNIQFSPHPSVNFVIGVNGSGKTSLLEAIALLSNGHSFRTRDIKKLVTYEQQQTVVFGKVSNPLARDRAYRMGISKDKSGNTLAKINGEKQTRVSELARLLPTVSIESSSLEFVEGSPNIRRSILDWGMFHVEHSYLSWWQKYRQAYRQKKGLLRMALSQRNKVSEQLSYWNRVLEESGSILDDLRVSYIEALAKELEQVASEYFGIASTIEVRYRPGWNKEKWVSLGDCLHQNMAKEIERQACLYGPHRADLELQWKGHSAKDSCSRGQKKLLLYGVRLAQVKLMAESVGKYPILLLDDLPAELDRQNISNIAGFLADFSCQTFITAINEKSIQDTLLSSNLSDHGMFHVEHGTLS